MADHLEAITISKVKETIKVAVALLWRKSEDVFWLIREQITEFFGITFILILTFEKPMNDKTKC